MIDFSFRMINFLMMKLSVLFWIFTLGGVMVFGQERVIDDIKFNNEPTLYKVSQNHFRLSYPVKRSGYLKFQVKIQDFDTLLNLIDTSSIQVRGRFELMASGRSQTATFNLLGDEEAQSLLLFRTDHKPHQTRTIQLKPISSNWNSKMSPLVIANKESEDVIVFFWNRKSDKYEIIFLENGDSQTWAKTMDVEEGFIPMESLLLNGHLFLVLTKGLGTRKLYTRMSVWDLASGTEKYIIPLDDDMRRKTLDNILRFDSSHVLLTGRTFFDKKVSMSKAGMPYIDRLNVVTGEATSLPYRLDDPAQKFFWTSVQKFNGSDYLMGELVRSTSSGSQAAGAIATGIFTTLATGGAMRLATAPSSIFLEDMVILNLSEDFPRIATIPAQTKSMTVLGYLPTFYFTRYAYENGLTHYMGITDDAQGFYFENGGEMIRLDMSDGSTRSLGFVKGKSHWKILNVTETKIMTVAKNSEYDLVLRCLDYVSEVRNKRSQSK
jgi:hypothetical protein